MLSVTDPYFLKGYCLEQREIAQSLQICACAQSLQVAAGMEINVRKKEINYLDYIPVCAPDHSFQLNEQGLVVIRSVNKGFYNKIAQKIWKRPQVSYISLDEYGSYVWQQMDGKKTIYEISIGVKEAYGKEAEPLLERLTRFFQILYQNHFIGYVVGAKKIR